jgi:ubiquinone/menaquinone biosynthesis C-methylase UbiE
MLSRTLEPEVMDTVEEARDYDAMDHAGVNRVFVSDFVAHWDGETPLLDAGTGTAQIPIELCRQAPTARVIAIDMAKEMLHVAEINVARAHLEGQITLQQCDAKHMPFPDSMFASIISNSIVHHIPEPSAVLAEMIRVTKPGGMLFVRDLMRPANEATMNQLVDTYAGDATAHQRQMFADSLKAALTLEEIRRLVQKLGHAPESVQQTSDRHWTWQTTK